MRLLSNFNLLQKIAERRVPHMIFAIDKYHFEFGVGSSSGYSISSILDDMKGIMKNKYYIMFIFFVFFHFMGYLVLYASIQYYFTYVVGSTSAMSISMSIMTIVPMPMMVLSSWLKRRFLSTHFAQVFSRGMKSAKLSVCWESFHFNYYLKSHLRIMNQSRQNKKIVLLKKRKKLLGLLKLSFPSKFFE